MEAVLAIDCPFSEEWNEDLIYTEEIESEKEERKFISNCVKLIRNSLEYRRWVKMVKFDLSYDECVITGDNDEDGTEIEIHHHPFQLYDLVSIVLDNFLKNGKKITTFRIAEEVMKMHYEGKIGFIPLISSLHHKIHSGNFIPPISWVRGNWEYLYHMEIREEIKEKVRKLIEVNEISTKTIEWPE